MQIVIDIPDKTYDYITKYQNVGGWIANTVTNAILGGTLLPKGHGRLKDVDHYIKMQWEHPDYNLIDDEPTIIEADEAESEE